MRISDWSSDVCSSDLLELTLIADDLGGLLRQRLVLALGLFNRLLDLHLRIGIFVDLGAEQRHQVLPRLGERIGHRFAPPSCLSLSRPWVIGRASCRERVCQYV